MFVYVIVDVIKCMQSYVYMFVYAIVVVIKCMQSYVYMFVYAIVVINRPRFEIYIHVSQFIFINIFKYSAHAHIECMENTGCYIS